MNECHCCGIPISYPNTFCSQCAEILDCDVFGNRIERPQVFYTSDDARRMRELLKIERMEHAKTRRKLEKADHDRKRYAKRIRLLDGRHNIICAEYRAVKKERDILKAALTACERSLLECQPDPQTKMLKEDSISANENTSPRENCME